MSKLKMRRSLNNIRLPKIADEEKRDESPKSKRTTRFDEDPSPVSNDYLLSRSTSVRKSRLGYNSMVDYPSSNPRLDKLFSIVFEHDTPIVTDNLVAGLVPRTRRSKQQLLEPIQTAQQTRLSMLRYSQQLTSRIVEEQQEMNVYAPEREDTQLSTAYPRQKSIYLEDRLFDPEINVTFILYCNILISAIIGHYES